MSQSKRRKQSKQSKQSKLWAGSLWAASSLFVALSVVPLLLALMPAFATSVPLLLGIAFGLLSCAAVALLLMVVITLPKRSAYDFDADFKGLPAVMRWPLRVGTWIGAAVLVVVSLILLIGGGGGELATTNARFAISMLATIAALLTLGTSSAVPAAVLVGLFIVWSAIIVMAFLRGAIGIFAPATA
ncbi:MAG: hypothetical protein GX862_04260 [Leucobacter sp.]|nr:hypothetical protein [Leucobacter sp.]